MKRDDIAGEKRAPKSYHKFLLEFGGRNPYQEPNWRLVWAPSRMEWRGGEICKWPDELAPADRGKMELDDVGGVRVSEYKPLSREVGVFRVPKFPDQPGWLLEMWWPAHKYGTREEWEQTTRDPKSGVLMLGPYPEYGDYEVMASFTSELPGIEGLQKLIQKQNWTMLQKHGSLADRIRQRIEEAEAQQKAREEKEMNAAMERVKDQLSPLFSTSLEAGRIREQWARRAGITGHVGN